jgi:hypothetical protein
LVLSLGRGPHHHGQGSDERAQGVPAAHDLPWNYSDYIPVVDRLEIRRWDMRGNDDHHFYGLCPVNRSNPSLMYGDHPKSLKQSSWQVLLNSNEVFTTASEGTHEDDEDSGVQEEDGQN